MSKRLVLIAVTALSMVCSGITEARVCWLGDTSKDCTSTAGYGPGAGSCSDAYHECELPRAGAGYCFQDGKALYTNEDCCSWLIANKGYKDCPNADEGDRPNGYGKSCLGTNNVRYWEFCGCPYGFIDTDDIAAGDLTVQGDLAEDNEEIPFDKRCGILDNVGTTHCKFTSCNADRRWFAQNGGEHCEYRLDTRCGSAWGCKQLYNCNNFTEDGKEYYRNEDVYLETGKNNFLEYDENDPLSNEKKQGEGTSYTDPLYGGEVPYYHLIIGYNEGNLLESSENYELTNKIVCAYEGEHGLLNETIKDGFGCNGVKNYCYLFDQTTLCNNTRGWFREWDNPGAVYYGDAAYRNWMKNIENNADYKNSYRGLYTSGVIKAINETFEYTDLHKTARGNFFAGEFDGEGNIIYEKTSYTGGCIYITHECHPDNTHDRHCYKRIACSSENGFYSSFINAANSEDLYYASFSGLTNASLAGRFSGISAEDHNEKIEEYKDLIYKVEYEKLNKKWVKDGQIVAEGTSGAKYAVNLDADQIDRYVYPACLYEINACNDTPDAGEKGGGCYRKTGCATDFVPEEEFEASRGGTVEESWGPWFRDARPVCNNLTRCYKATACELSVGAYSSSPNTSFFIVGSSTESGLTCYRGMDCNYDAGAYSSAPNTSFFIQINSIATGSTCYRGESCHIVAGAYSSTPNTSFFNVITSEASGSISYRAESAHVVAGAYSSTPNTSFFMTISSEASGSIAYRGESAHIVAGAYSSTPNTSFFRTISSEASGSIAYRGESAHIVAGAYSSTPNTSFFRTISSEASGSIAYRGESAHIVAGAYSSTPNTSFFRTISSEASGSIAYRGESAHIVAGAYSSTPNTSFFLVISSEASGSTSYRAESAHIAAGAYSSTPSTSFFNVITSEASGSTCYRGESCYLEAGAYSSTPNTSFFWVVKSSASGSICYRGIECQNINAGVYTTSPNTEFFEVIYSKASGSECYRGQNCEAGKGAYSSSPNTSFFVTISSSASGSMCYRATGCYIEVGAYSSAPNTEFFKVIESAATGQTCYRGESCGEAAGAYSSVPNTVFFISHESVASGSTCYRGKECAETANANPNTSYFVFVTSSASGSICYRSSACNFAMGAYSSIPNTSFFLYESSTNATNDSTCYRGTECHIAAGAYSSAPNTSFFKYITSEASGSTSYRANEANIIVGAYSSTPNTSFFNIITSHASGSKAYRADKVCVDCGAYSSEPNTSFFKYITSEASGSTSYRANEVHIVAGAYSSTPNTAFFITITSHASGSISYRAESANFAGGAYTTAPNTSFFDMMASHASGSISYRGDAANIPAGAYSSKPNTSFFFVISSQASGSTSYRAESAHIAAGAYSSTPNTSFFRTISSLASGSTAYRADKICVECGAYSSTPNTSFFFVISSSASGSKAYRGEEAHVAAGAYSSAPNTVFFVTISSKASGSTCYRGEKCANTANATNDESYFVFVNSKASGSICYRSKGCNLANGAYSTKPNTSFFNILEKTNAASDSTCYRGKDCRTNAGSYSVTPNVSFFDVISSLSSGTECFRARDCNVGIGSVRENNVVELINTSFFKRTVSKASGSTCYRGDTCEAKVGSYSESPNAMYFFHTISSTSPSPTTCFRADKCELSVGAYSSSPNTSFFITISSSASGSTCYRGTDCRAAAGAYSSSPNTNFFVTIHSQASGATNNCYRGIECDLTKGAYSSQPNTSFFNVITSEASGSTCYRIDGVNACDETSKENSAEINTSFFHLTGSEASGKACYRGDTCELVSGAYSVSPSVSYFHTISSVSPTNGTICYRADGCNIIGGAYSSSPNTSFFITSKQEKSSSICYRGNSCHLASGAYATSPNVSFFKTIYSLASSKKCFRGTECADNSVIEGSQDRLINTSYFKQTVSKASGSVCYRGDSCNTAAGSYSVEPNTSYFHTISSTSPTPTTCFRVDRCNFENGAYSSVPNTSFFITGGIRGSGSTCYRGSNCRLAAGAYSSTPNSIFFATIFSKASGLTCYRATGCSETYKSVSDIPNTSYFATINSKASGLTCYRANGCHIAAGAYSSTPSEAFFIVGNMTHQQKTAEATPQNENYTCYRGTSCIPDVSYKEAEKPNAQYFLTISSKASGSTCYRAIGCNFEGGAYSSVPNTSFFKTNMITKTGSTCYRGINCNTDAGAYATSPSVSFFKTIHSLASSKKCFRATGCSDEAVTEENKDRLINTSFFIRSEKSASDIACYRGDSCNTAVGSYSVEPNTSYFHTISSTSPTPTTCFRADRCNFEGGAYSSVPNTSFFITSGIGGSGSTCYRGTNCRLAAGAYSSTPNTVFFATINSKASGLTCYRATDCRTGYSSATRPDGGYFASISSQASSKTCYRVTGCSSTAYTSKPNTEFFMTSSMQYNQRDANGTQKNYICYKGIGCINDVSYAATEKPNTSFFLTISSSASGLVCYRANGCRIAAGAYEAKPNARFFLTVSSIRTGKECYRGTACNTNNGSYSSKPDTDLFKIAESLASGSRCYRATACAAGAYSGTNPPNTSFFKVKGDTKTGFTCYRATACNEPYAYYPINRSSLAPDYNYFQVTESTASGVTCYRADSCNIAGGAYSVAPNSCIVSFSSRSRTIENNVSFYCYRADKCKIVPTECYFTTSSTSEYGLTCTYVTGVKNAYMSQPNTNVFTTETVAIDGSTYAVNKSGSDCAEYTAYGVTGCNNSNYWYDSTANTSYFNNCHFNISTPQQAGSCSGPIKCYTYASAKSINYNESKWKSSDSTTYSQPYLSSAEGAGNWLGTYVFNTATTTVNGGTTSGNQTLTAEYINGCRANYCWYTSNANTDFFIYNERRMENQNLTCTGGTSCYKVLDARCKTSPDTNKFVVTSMTACGYEKDGTGYKNDDVSADVTGYKATGCNNTNGWYSDKPNVTYFYPTTATSSTNCGGQTCYSATCQTGYRDSLPADYYYEITSGTWHGKKCLKCGCKYGDRSQCDTGYFIVDSDDNEVANECASTPAYCLKGNLVEGTACHLTVDQRCSGTAPAEVEVGSSGSKCVVNGNSNYTSDSRYNYAQYFLWGSPKTCGNTTRKVPTGCNEDKLSYNATYGSSAMSSTLFTVVSGTQDEATTPSTYGQVFSEGFDGGCSSYHTCYNKCSCNEGNGWFASPGRAKAYAASDPDLDENGTLVGLQTTRQYAIYTASTNVTGNANNSSTLVGLQSTRQFASNISLASTSEITAYNGKQTCYHAPIAPKCPDGYFEDTSVNSSYKNYFNYTSTTTAGGKVCYKILGCNETNYYFSNLQNASCQSHTWHGTTCYAKPQTYTVNVDGGDIQGPDYSGTFLGKYHADITLKCPTPSGGNKPSSLTFSSQTSDILFVQSFLNSRREAYTFIPSGGTGNTTVTCNNTKVKVGTIANSDINSASAKPMVEEVVGITPHVSIDHIGEVSNGSYFQHGDYCYKMDIKSTFPSGYFANIVVEPVIKRVANPAQNSGEIYYYGKCSGDPTIKVKASFTFFPPVDYSSDEVVLTCDGSEVLLTNEGRITYEYATINVNGTPFQTWGCTNSNCSYVTSNYYKGQKTANVYGTFAWDNKVVNVTLKPLNDGTGTTCDTLNGYSYYELTPIVPVGYTDYFKYQQQPYRIDEEPKSCYMLMCNTSKVEAGSSEASSTCKTLNGLTCCDKVQLEQWPNAIYFSITKTREDLAAKTCYYTYSYMLGRTGTSAMLGNFDLSDTNSNSDVLNAFNYSLGGVDYFPINSGSLCTGSNVWHAGMPYAESWNIYQNNLKSVSQGCSAPDDAVLHPEQCDTCSGSVCALRKTNVWELNICGSSGSVVYTTTNKMTLKVKNLTSGEVREIDLAVGLH